jgi:hypothetical protein
MSRSIHPKYDAAERYERRATRRQRADQATRRVAIRLSIAEAL